jgi:hypothetical protein
VNRFAKDTRGSAPLWAAFITVVLCMLSVLAYTGATLFSAYRSAQTELERAVSISVDVNMKNRYVRDLVLDIPQEPVLTVLGNNLESSGWEKGADGTWKRFDDTHLVYALRGVNAEVHGDLLDVSAVFVLPLPWAIGSRTEVQIPVSFYTKVIYLN